MRSPTPRGRLGAQGELLRSGAGQLGQPREKLEHFGAAVAEAAPAEDVPGMVEDHTACSSAPKSTPTK